VNTDVVTASYAISKTEICMCFMLRDGTWSRAMCVGWHPFVERHLSNTISE